MIFLKKNGFTLLEMLVALTIYIIMALLLLANQDKFNSTLSFSNLAYDVALSIRQAQTYSYAVLNSSVSPSPYEDSFGVHFDLTSPTSFIVFAEPVTGNAVLAPVSPIPYNTLTDSVVSTYNLQNGYTVSALCDEDKTPENCLIKGAADIIFQRPNTNAYIYYIYLGVNNSINHLRIKLISPTQTYEWIDVYQSGDIEVVNPTDS